MGFNTFLMTDFYKTTHLMQFSPEIVHLTSYLTPRSTRFNNINKMVWFGVQGFINKYLVENFRINFFDKNYEDIVDEVTEVLKSGLNYKQELITKTLDKVHELWALGYLPIEINALPEGTLVPMGVPALEIRTTRDGFAWVGQSIESLLSCSIWHPCISATIAYEYAKIAKRAYARTVENDISWKTAMCDFSMRGQESYESAIASSVAWLTTFYNSSTVDAKGYIKENYWDRFSIDKDGSNLYDKLKIGGLTSTEHSVMTSDFALTGDERKTYQRLLTEVYPDVSFAAVCDSYDFWNVLTNILPSLRAEIEAHEGFIGVRHDSAEPVEALCGLRTYNINKIIHTTIAEYPIHDHIEQEIEEDMMDYLYDFINVNRNPNSPVVVMIRATFDTNIGSYDKVYEASLEQFTDQGDWHYTLRYVKETDWKEKGMVETIYELFGGTRNSKGFKVMNPKLKAIYGDSITIQRAKKIYDQLEEKGYAANNVSLGVGSFSMECLEEDNILKPFTRDSFSIAIKATYGRTAEGKEIEIYKDPKDFSQKKSLKGLCIPYYDEKGTLKVMQGLKEKERTSNKYLSDFKTYFKEGPVYFSNFSTIREKINTNLEKEEL